MTAWERWEMADFSGKPAAKGSAQATKAAQPPTPAPTVEAPPPPPPPPPAPPEPEFKLPTLEEIEQIHQQAQKSGYDAGYEEGTARVRMEAMRISTLADHLDQAMSDLDKQVAEELLGLALEIARQVVRQQIEAKPAVVLNAIKEALLQLPHQHATIYLNPDDANLVRNYIGDQLSHAGHRIMEEPLMARGGCKVEAAGSQIDATLETRWRRVLESMGQKDDWIEEEEEEP